MRVGVKFIVSQGTPQVHVLTSSVGFLMYGYLPSRTFSFSTAYESAAATATAKESGKYVDCVTILHTLLQRLTQLVATAAFKIAVQNGKWQMA